MLINGEANQSLNYAIHLNTNRRVGEVQFSQILEFAAKTPLRGPQLSLKDYQALRNRRRRQNKDNNETFWNSPLLQTWADAETSSLILVRGSFNTRHSARDFSADIIDVVRKANIPVIWALNAQIDEAQKEPLTIAVLKHLVLQALQINQTILDEQSISLNAARFQSATTEQEWFDLLAAVLSGLPQIYIIVDVEVLGTLAGEELAWPMAFLQLFGELMARNIPTRVKVALVHYQTRLLTVPPSALNPGVVHIPPKRGVVAAKNAVARRSRGTHKGRAQPARMLPLRQLKY